jgi:hypothetical protein
MKNKKWGSLYNFALPICLCTLGGLITTENSTGTIGEIITTIQTIIFAVSGSIVIKLQNKNN